MGNKKIDNNRITSSPELLEFYRAYQTWIENGTPDYKPFSRGQGLCDNAFDYASNETLSNEMVWQFIKANLNAGYPFGGLDYLQRQRERTLHLCPKRLAWVRDRIKDMEE